MNANFYSRSKWLRKSLCSAPNAASTVPTAPIIVTLMRITHCRAAIPQQAIQGCSHLFSVSIFSLFWLWISRDRRGAEQKAEIIECCEPKGKCCIRTAEGRQAESHSAACGRRLCQGGRGREQQLPGHLGPGAAILLALWPTCQGNPAFHKGIMIHI